MNIVYTDNYGSAAVRLINFEYTASDMDLIVKKGPFVWQGRNENGEPLPWLQQGATGMPYMLEQDEHVTVTQHQDAQVITGHLVRNQATNTYHVMAHVCLSPLDPPLMPPINGYDLLYMLFHLEVPAQASSLSNATLYVNRLIEKP